MGAGTNAAHVEMHGWRNWQGLFCRVNAGLLATGINRRKAAFEMIGETAGAQIEPRLSGFGDLSDFGVGNFSGL